MAVNRVPVLKRCRSLGLEPSYLGYDKKSNRISLQEQTEKVSEYGLQLTRETESEIHLWRIRKTFQKLL